jgi:type I restriction enzyme S subunit
MELPTLTISAGNGWMRQEDRFSGNIAGKEQRNYTLLHRGELSYNHGNSKLAKYGAVFSLQTYEEALVPRVYHSFKVENGDADFVEYYFATKLPDKELGKLISSGARMDGLLNIGYEEFMGIPFLFPNEEEQSKISSYFRTLDHLITLHQRECEQAKKYKKYMLQKMFPQNGSNVPEIRFSGFTYAWEQRKLPEFVTFYNGQTYTPDDVQESGTLVLRSSNVKNGEIVDADNVYINPEIASADNVQEGDIIVVVRNGSRALIGKHAQIKDPKPNTVIGAFMSGMRSEHSSFVNALLDTSAFENEIAKNMGATINQITGYMFSKMEFVIPTDDEQEKIGEYFANLDHLITLHQQKPIQQKYKND